MRGGLPSLQLSSVKEYLRHAEGYAGPSATTVLPLGAKAGVPTAADIDRLSKNVPLQEAGRISDSELSLSRANRSVRLFQHVLDKLSVGEQPELEQIQN